VVSTQRFPYFSTFASCPYQLQRGKITDPSKKIPTLQKGHNNQYRFSIDEKQANRVLRPLIVNHRFPMLLPPLAMIPLTSWQTRLKGLGVDSPT
jgi:hypothetical protein